MEKVRNKFEYITRETDEVLYYDHEEFKKAVSYDQGFDDGIKKGVEQGIEQGIEQKQKEIVINMLKENFDIELISKVTNLTIDKINNLKNIL